MLKLHDFCNRAPKREGGRSVREERIIAGFEEIQRFVEGHGRTPQHGEDKDIFERLYAVRLDRLRAMDECRALLAPLDHQGLLSGAEIAQADSVESMDDEELLAELEGAAGPSDITELRHVRSRAEIRAAEEIANRERCEDFDRFQPLFQQAESELKSGIRQTRPFGRDASVTTGNFFILGGQLVYVAEMGDVFRTPNGEPDARLRVIYSNGTESNLLLRSLQRALYKDQAGRRLTDPNAGPLFSETWEEDDIASGTIYVLRSLSSHPFVAEHRELIHKIGVTGGKVESRIANAAHDATYLLAEVEVVASYKLAGVNRTKLEGIFHRIFAPAQLDLTIQDRFGHPVRPREWFLVPLHVIDEAVRRILDGSISDVVYDPKTARLVG
ncbi:hypothetical protein AO896_07705 [Pseudomonas aeruginosa]|uniref:GIY-YIG nuclease family protein n=1 Tax=Pseudomonas aeruginosa TaxID=287 RepID=UPI00071B2A90|nr:GIY-YIG nuclease family protein [Pseudomonas aeruginosa]KSC92255.1 hypothetical protein AO896_07705 [Pseudomonas aeruginosa]